MRTAGESRCFIEAGPSGALREPGQPLGEQGVEALVVGAADVEDVARAVAYLASEYDGFITGATLDINGGVYYA